MIKIKKANIGMRIDKYATKLRSSINQDNTILSNYEEDGHLKE